MMRRLLLSCSLGLLVWSCGGGAKPPPGVDSGTPLPSGACFDNDGDGFNGTGACDGEPSFDCNDDDRLAYPSAPEQCNGRDDNCNGQVDEGLSLVDFYADGDGDGAGSAKTGEGCQAPPTGSVAQGGDCDDTNPTIKPGATELCNQVDDDCDGQVDDGLAFASYFFDADGDGFGNANAAAESSCAPVPGKATNHADCNDRNPAIKPGAPESCNALDDDCDGQVDEDLPFDRYFVDVDGDGFGAVGAPPQSACAPIPGAVTNADDCDDLNPAMKPGAPETCNAVDDDCDGVVDDGLTFTATYADQDGDGFGAGSAQSACAHIPGRVTTDTDCDDLNPAIKPGAPETCNAVDDDCDGQPDDGLAFADYSPDADGDGYGRAGAAVQRACLPIPGRVTNALDCDDTRASVRPGAAEVCNGLDDDCAGGVDDGLTFSGWYLDADADGFGAGAAVTACSQPTGRVATSTDCNDANASIRPGAPELCNGVDDDCDTLVDNGVTTQDYFPDADGDGFGASGAAPQPSCSAVAGKVTNATDCNDASASIRPGAVELCNGVDDNCAGGVDEGLTFLSYFPDADADGFGAAGAVAQPACAAVAGKVSNDLDCNDTSSAIHPGALEVCNGVDDDCTGQVDEGNPGGGGACSTGQAGLCAAGTQTCTAGSLQCVRDVAPSTERCNGLDDDCDGQTDEDFAGLGTACTAGLGVCLRTGAVQCAASGTGTQCSAAPGAPTAAACDGLDNDCDGVVDEPVLTATANVTATAWQDLEVVPYYFSAAGCAGGVTGAGTDALAGGGLAMAVGAGGIAFQPLTSAGAPAGSLAAVTSLGYSDVALAQAGDGFVIAGVWSVNDAELDLYYVDALGAVRTYRYTEFRLPVGCAGTDCHRLDSLRVVRGNGRRVTLVWREDTVGVRLAQVEACSVSGSWELRAPGCATATLTPVTVVASAAVLPGLGADSTHQDWGASQSCPSAATRRRLGLTYRPSATQVSFFQVDEDGANKTLDSTVYSVTAPRVLAEPDVAYFKDGSAADQFFVAYVTKDSGAVPPDADLNYWLTNDPTWHYAYLAYADQNGVDSILRPRVSVTASRVWMTALRFLTPAEEPTAFKRQVMTRQTDLTGGRVPLGAAVELSTTSGACGDAACRPGDKAGFTAHAAFGRVYYSGAGSTPSGSYASTLSCH